MTRGTGLFLSILGLGLAGPALRASDIAGAIVVLEALEEPRAGLIPEAAPPRFVLTESGDVFVGGTSRVLSGRLAKADLAALDKKIALVRKMRLISPLTFGPGTERRRLVLAQGKRLEIVATGDPSAAPVALRPLTSLLSALEEFGHPALRPYRPASYRLIARQAPLAGGCWPWTFTVSPEAAVAAPTTVSSPDNWPTGAVSGSACAGGKTYQINLRPLLPGEK